jgi:hypothetical protein
MPTPGGRFPSPVEGIIPIGGKPDIPCGKPIP